MKSQIKFLAGYLPVICITAPLPLLVFAFLYIRQVEIYSTQQTHSYNSNSSNFSSPEKIKLYAEASCLEALLSFSSQRISKSKGKSVASNCYAQIAIALTKVKLCTVEDNYQDSFPFSNRLFLLYRILLI